MNKDGEAIASPFVFGHQRLRSRSSGSVSNQRGIAAGEAPCLKADFDECCDPKEDQALWRSFGSNIATYLFDNSCAIRAHT